MFKHLLVAMIVCVGSLAVQAMPAGWTDDFEAAKKQAVEEGKDLLVDFSGSDWCGWCKKLDKEVFSQPEFVKEASKDFVLVLIDSPKDQSILSDTAKANNPGLVKQYEITGFPAVLLMNSSGEAYARTGYQAGGVEPYLRNLADLKEKNTRFNDLLAASKGLEGVAKARKLDEAISTLSEDVRRGKIDLINDMLAADPENAAGLKEKYAFYTEFLPLETAFSQKQREALAPLNKKFKSLNRDDPELNTKIGAIRAEADSLMKPLMKEKIKALDNLLARTSFDGEKKQTVLLSYIQAYQLTGEKENMLEAMQAARDAAPDTRIGQSITRALNKMPQAQKEGEKPE